MSVFSKVVGLAIIGAASLAVLPSALAAPAPQGPTINTEDVTRFYTVYDAAGGHPTEAQLQKDYVDAGSDALHQFAKMRQISGASLVKAIDKHPDVYVKAKSCEAVLPGARQRVTVALSKLGKLYPEATFPPVTILIGRNSTGGTTSAAGVLIGLETICGADWMESNLEDRFVHLISHEYAHVQQPAAQDDDAKPTVLFAAEVEGGAEFIAELISGSVSNTQLQVWTKGREKEIETAFVADEDKLDLKDWLYNGHGDKAKPGDLAYWVGYRITKSYYQHAKDKTVALREIIQVKDPHAFLDKSGWYPGIVLK